jgi:hypothetical protein
MGDAPDGFFVRDGVHPTTRVQCSCAGDIRRALDDGDLIVVAPSGTTAL